MKRATQLLLVVAAMCLALVDRAAAQAGTVTMSQLLNDGYEIKTSFVVEGSPIFILQRQKKAASCGRPRGLGPEGLGFAKCLVFN
jgi:hypothetical protein